MEYIVEKIGMSRTITNPSIAVTLLRVVNAKVCEVEGGKALVAYPKGKASNKCVAGQQKKYNLSALEEENPVLQCSDLVLDTKKHECLVDDVPVSLTPTEFSILQILLEAKGNVVSGEELFHRIWKDEYYIKSNNTITVHIRRLREKLNDTLENPKYIKTIWGVVYKFDEI